MTKHEFNLSIQRWVNAPPNLVFDAWTDAEIMKKWWGLKDATCPTIEIDLRVGGRYRIANLLPDGRTIWISGIYQKIERPNRLIYTWSVNEGDDEIVDVVIKPDGKGSILTICHMMVPDMDTRNGHQRGWTDSLSNLDIVLSSISNTILP